jgi:hypothetical protein
VKNRNLVLITILALVVLACKDTIYNISPDNYNNMNLGGRIIVQLITDTDTTIFQANATDAALMYHKSYFGGSYNSPERIENQLELSLKNFLPQDNNFAIYGKFYNENYSSNKQFGPDFKQDTLYAFGLGINGFLSFSAPQLLFYYGDGILTSDDAATLFITNTTTYNSPTTLTIDIQKLESNYFVNNKLVKHIIITAETYLQR